MGNDTKIVMKLFSLFLKSVPKAFKSAAGIYLFNLRVFLYPKQTNQLAAKNILRFGNFQTNEQ